MTFFDPQVKKEKHVCKPPEPSVLQKKGWRCYCGKAFVKVSESQHGETWEQWTRSPEYDAS